MDGILLPENQWESRVIHSSKFSLILFVEKNVEICISAKNIISHLLMSTSFLDLEFYTIDVFESPKISLQYRISIIPTLICIKNRQKIYEKICEPDLESLEKLFELIRQENL
jgi:hypothetical protein